MKLIIFVTFAVLAFASFYYTEAAPYEGQLQEFLSKYKPELLNKTVPEIQAYVQQEAQKQAEQQKFGSDKQGDGQAQPDEAGIWLSLLGALIPLLG